MGATAWAEVQLALTGAFRLARGDRGGLFCFDRSLEGFWRSFRAAVICYPLSLLLLTMRINVGEWQRSGGWRVVAIETISYVIGWVAFPLIMLSVTRWIGRATRYFDFIVPYNWCQLPEMALVVLIGTAIESGFIRPQAGAVVVMLLIWIAYPVYEWYIARVALGATIAEAIFIVLVDISLARVIARVAGILY